MIIKKSNQVFSIEQDKIAEKIIKKIAQKQQANIEFIRSNNFYWKIF